MMRVGKRARYTLRLMMDIGREDRRGKPVPIGSIARTSGISRRYLDQLTLPLKNAALINSHSGRNGGYTLGKPASDISIGEILKATDGPVIISECVADPSVCLSSAHCGCRLLFSQIQQRLTDLLAEYSLADLIKGTGPWSSAGSEEPLAQLGARMLMDGPAQTVSADSPCLGANLKEGTLM